MLKIEKKFQNKISTIYFLPFFPGNLEITQSIIKLLGQIKPSALAITLPFFVKEKWIIAVKNLPKISIVALIYKDKKTEYLIVEPLCPLVETTRYAFLVQTPEDLLVKVLYRFLYNIFVLLSQKFPQIW